MGACVSSCPGWGPARARRDRWGRTPPPPSGPRSLMTTRPSIRRRALRPPRRQGPQQGTRRGPNLNPPPRGWAVAPATPASSRPLPKRRRSPRRGEPKPPAPKPSHQHSWAAVYRTEPVYGQQWVSKWEDVYTRHERWACGCGQTFDNWNSCTAHRAAMAEAGNPCGRVVDDSYTMVEKVDRGSYQTIQTGSKQVLDHYECSCGATR